MPEIKMLYNDAEVILRHVFSANQHMLFVDYRDECLFSCEWGSVITFPIERRVIVISFATGKYAEFFYQEGTTSLWSYDGKHHIDLSFSHKKLREKEDKADDYIRTLLAGRVTRIVCSTGARVVRGAPLAYIEAMKMENEITADRDGIIKTILIQPGNVVKPNEPLVLFQKKGE